MTLNFNWTSHSFLYGDCLKIVPSFLRREAKKLRDTTMFWPSCSSSIFSFLRATFSQVTFFNYHFTDPLTSSNFLERGSSWETSWENIPILLRTGPSTIGICLMFASVARRLWYFFVHFLMSFLSLLNFLRLSTVVTSTAKLLATTSSACF
jgi:hypothetical protein